MRACAFVYIFRCWACAAFVYILHFFFILQTTRKSNLVQHKLTHSKEKPHQCEYCGRSFSLAKNMRRHARQHDTNATIYKCKINNCNFKTLRSDKFVEHMKKYHPEDDELDVDTMMTKTNPNPNPTKKMNIIKAEIQIKAEQQVTLEAPPVESDAFKRPQITKVGAILASSPFNTVSPPNKTVSDTYDANSFNDADFEEAILASNSRSEDDMNQLVTPLL
jgi:hypothetical protein